MKADPQTAASLIQVHQMFCSGFASRDADAIMHLFAPDPEVVMITSEESLLRGRDSLNATFRERPSTPGCGVAMTSVPLGTLAGCSPRERRSQNQVPANNSIRIE